MKFRSLLILFFFANILNAQNDWRIAKHTSSLDHVDRLVLPELDNELLLQQELNRRGPGIAPRFAESIDVDITPDNHGTWDYTVSGKAVWRFRIHSKDAKSLNLGFTKFFLPEGGMLVIYSPDMETIDGPFTPADNEEHEQLWTPVFEGDELVVEVQVPAQNKSQLQLKLSSINHDFLGFGAVVSGSCNVDVLCGIDDGFPEIEEHRDIIQSVAVIGLNGGTFCTGFLVNNARQDCTPFFMTADHCGIDNGNAASLVAYWNFQNSSCREPGSTASGQDGNGLLNMSNTGSIFRSGSGTSDFTLVELDDPVNENADAYMAGWDRGSTAPSSAVCVHHPNTEEKRISFEDNPLTMTDGFTNGPSSNFTHVRVTDWDLGTTEPGSSGSPLFDQNERVVGQLHGGGAACGNNQSDWYGAFARSWTGNSSSSTRLSDWLDPDGTGVMTVDGIEASFCTFGIEPIQANLQACPDEEATFALIPSLNFTSDVTLDITNVPAGASFSLSVNPVPPGDTTYLTISNLSALALDDYIINVNASDSENSALGMLVLSVIETPLATTLTTPSDNATNIGTAPTYFWNSVPSASTYHIEVATDEAFTDIVTEATVTSSTHNAGGLENGTLYYWRVTTTNQCGESTSEVSSFTTLLDLAVVANPVSIALCNTETANFNITIGSDFSESGATLSATNLPTGASIIFNTNPLPAGQTSSVSISDLEGNPSGTYTITINVDDGVNSNTRNIGLFLEAAPTPVDMNAPADNAVEVDQTPQFIWVPSSDAQNYTIEIATDQDFNNIVEGTTTNITVFTVPSDLAPSTVYYWRVIANGDCGNSTSDVRSFTTIIIDEVVELNNTLIDIRPNPTSGLLNISLSGLLSGDLMVEVYGINGQQLLSERRTGVTQFDVNLSNYPDGVYLLKLVNEQSVLTRKIILSK